MNPDTWERFRSRQILAPAIGLRLDLSLMGIDDAWLDSMRPRVDRALAEMAAIERGEVVNTDEQRRVGHYWLRAPELAPEPAMRRAIEEALVEVKRVAGEVHAGRMRGAGGPFTDLVVIGIGGSSLGPRFVADALGSSRDRLRPHFLDNTDPDGFDRVFDAIGARLATTLTLVISKSGGTKETRNGMLEAKARYAEAGLRFGDHALAITGEGSALDREARAERFLAILPMWDWVGGRTSELSAVGLLPAALQGFDVDAIVAGARDCDAITRVRTERPLANPAMALALAWHLGSSGRGAKDMVILPYKDRLALLSQYLQQLVMESIGKELDRDGQVVHQGLSVYGNKGSTDQHAYVQQLRDGVDNFFVTFVSVQRDRREPRPPLLVEDDATSGDYLHGFLLGTRAALAERGRRSITLVIDEVSAHRVGALIALYERAVGFYAGLVNVNAYNQPGVEAGKKAAEAVLALQRRALAVLRAEGRPLDVEAIATKLGAPDATETIFQILEHLAQNPERGVRREPGADPLAARYGVGRGTDPA